jgi:hypothetical protein
MAGAVGGGGVGDLALTYGYQRFNTPLMTSTVIILIIFVQIIQVIGTRSAKKALALCKAAKPAAAGGWSISGTWNIATALAGTPEFYF